MYTYMLFLVTGYKKIETITNRYPGASFFERVEATVKVDGFNSGCNFSWQNIADELKLTYESQGWINVEVGDAE